MNINFQYLQALRRISEQKWEENKRTGLRCKAIPGVTIRTDIQKDGFPLLSLRKIPFTFVPEVMWFLSGDDNIKNFLQKHTKIWDAFAEEDGTVTSAYGKRWAKSGQLDRVIKALKNDPSTRHAVVVTWDPEKDGVMRQKNVPCPYTFTLMIIGGRLHMHNVVRSNDMVLGFPTDAAGFAFLQCMIAQELGIEPGIYTHTISNAHYYENQEHVVLELLGRKYPNRPLKLKMPPNSLQRAKDLDESLIDDMRASLVNYEPLEAIRHIPIAV